MKLLEFVKKHPSHAKGAIYLLSIGLAANFAALLVLGFAIFHGKQVEKNTNAALIAGDVLAVYETQKNGTGDDSVYRALIDARISSCLPHGDAAALVDILEAGGSRFEKLCEKLRKAAEDGRCTVAELSAAIRESISGEEAATRSSAADGEAVSDIRRGFRLYDTKKLAEEFFGVRYVFRTAGDLSYCGNLCGRFNEKTGRLTAYASEWTMNGREQLPQEECVCLAQTFAEQRAGIRNTSVESVRFAEGVCWVEILDANADLWKIGVCADTGRICFFCPMQGAVSR